MGAPVRRKSAFAEALAAAVLFGIATPFSKALLADIHPNQLAGLLYLGAALFLVPAMIARARRGEVNFPPDRRNRLLLLGAIFFGGVTGPVLLLVGLSYSMAASVSMWLNLETVATAILAYLFFKEHIGKWTWLGNAGVVAAGLMLSYDGGWAGVIGILCVAGAGISWGLDNNFTALIDSVSPVDSTFWKGSVAGATNLAIGMALFPWSVSSAWGYALLLGGISYGASIVLYITSAQALGATRSQMIFASSPFFGVFLSVLWLGEGMSLMQCLAGGLLVAAVGLILLDSHGHEHEHDGTTHEHKHRHDDDHHTHVHEGGVGSLVHSHVHVHEPLVHRHPHWPDLHHRHEHG